MVTLTLCRAEQRYIQQTAKYGGRYEKVDRFKVYKKAWYQCYLCRCQVFVTPLQVDRAATLDHVIPLSKGGDHTYSNTRCCCRGCNLKKGCTSPSGSVGDGSRKG